MQWPPGAHHEHHLALACLPQLPGAHHEHHWVSACGAGHATATRSASSASFGLGLPRGRACRSFPARITSIIWFRLASCNGHWAHIMIIIWPWLASGLNVPQLFGSIMSIIWLWLASELCMQRPPTWHGEHHSASACEAKHHDSSKSAACFGSSGQHDKTSTDVGASMIRIGFWVPLYYIYTKEPPKEYRQSI